MSTCIHLLSQFGVTKSKPNRANLIRSVHTATGTVDTSSRWSMASLRSALPSPSMVSASSSSSTHCGHRGLRLSLSLTQYAPKPQKYFGSFTGLSPFNPLGLSDNTSFEHNFTIIDSGGRVYAMRHGRKAPKLNRPPDDIHFTITPCNG